MRRILALAGAVAMIASAGVTAVHAQPTPPTRFFGTATLDGKPAPDGTTITASIGSTSCGTGSVTGGNYQVDVASASTRPGCGTDGATVTFTVGSAKATQTGTFQTGAFVNLALTATSAAQATATPTAAPATATRTATPAPATATRTPTTPPTVVRTPSATPSRTPTAAPATATPQRPAAPPAAPAAPAPAPRLPSTGTGTGSDAGTGLLGAIAALTVLGGGLVVARRRRS